jgi:hypothetical protein
MKQAGYIGQEADRQMQFVCFYLDQLEAIFVQLIFP